MIDEDIEEKARGDKDDQDEDTLVYTNMFPSPAACPSCRLLEEMKDFA